MKQLIAPVAIIIALLVFFVIVDRREFNRYYDVQTVPSKTLTSNKKPLVSAPETKSGTELKPVAETKPAEARPVETKTIAETRPTETMTVETMPVAAETRPAEVKPVTEMKTDKPAEIKPMAETKTDVMPTPIAVPVVTAEEAEKLNAFAVFFSTVKPTIVEGEITERSELPDPQKSDYPNCRFTAHFNGNSIIFGDPCPKEISLILEGFANYKMLASSNIAPGDKVECVVIPFDSLSEEFKVTQQADDLNLFLLESYYVIDIKKIDSFTDNSFMPHSGTFFSDGNKEYVSIFKRHLNPPISQEVKDAQMESIRKDIEKMSGLLNNYDREKIKSANDSFNKAWNEEKKKDPSDYNRVGDIVWRNVDNSFWCLPDNYTILSEPISLSPKILDGFSALKEACEANGVQLIVSLIPDMGVISARVINKEFRAIPDLQTAIYVKQLSEIGVETIYSVDAIIDNYNRFPFAFFFPQNAHPSDTTQDVCSDILVERLRRYQIPQLLNPDLFSINQSPHVYGKMKEYLFPNNCDIGSNEAGTAYTCREILYDGKRIPRVRDAPIITLGNSFMQTPMGTPDTLPTLISMKLLTPVDFLRVEATGPFTSIVSQILATPERFLEHKRVLIMQFGTNALSDTNLTSLIVNIREGDENRLLFAGKTNVLTYDNLSSVKTDDSINDRLWNDLLQKHVYVISETGTSDVARFSIESSIDDSKEVICMIPAVCYIEQSASFSVNGIKKSIPTFYKNPFYSLISFKLPPGTKTIDISLEGEKGTAVAIRNIQIWQ